MESYYLACVSCLWEIGVLSECHNPAAALHAGVGVCNGVCHKTGVDGEPHPLSLPVVLSLSQLADLGWPQGRGWP